VPKALAESWLRKAADQGNERAQKLLESRIRTR